MSSNKYLCYSCMEYKDIEEICPVCHETLNDITVEKKLLPVGSILSGKYIVGKLLHRDGYENIYIGLDIKTNEKICIHEFYPTELIDRDTTSSLDVEARSLAEKICFDRNKEKYIDRAEFLCNLEDMETLEKAQCFFEENNTAYMICEYIVGDSLNQLCEKNRISDIEILGMMRKVIECVEVLHNNHYYASEITPKTILMSEGKVRMLIRSGELKYQLAKEIQNREIKPESGYSANELYWSSLEKIGVKTDVYAVAAVLYTALSGIKLPDDTKKMSDVKKIEKVLKKHKVPSSILSAIDHGLGLDGMERSDNFHEFEDIKKYNELPLIKAAGNKMKQKKVSSKTEKKPKKKHRFNMPYIDKKTIITGIIAVILMTVIITVLSAVADKSKKTDTSDQAKDSTVSTESAISASPKIKSNPTQSPTPTLTKTEEPTIEPTPEPTATPTIKPTKKPKKKTVVKTKEPYVAPTQAPAVKKTAKPKKPSEDIEIYDDEKIDNLD